MHRHRRRARLPHKSRRQLRPQYRANSSQTSTPLQAACESNLRPRARRDCARTSRTWWNASITTARDGLDIRSSCDRPAASMASPYLRTASRRSTRRICSSTKAQWLAWRRPPMARINRFDQRPSSSRSKDKSVGTSTIRFSPPSSKDFRLRRTSRRMNSSLRSDSKAIQPRSIRASRKNARNGMPHLTRQRQSESRLVQTDAAIRHRRGALCRFARG